MPEIRHFAMGTDAQTIADAIKARWRNHSR